MDTIWPAGTEHARKVFFPSPFSWAILIGWSGNKILDRFLRTKARGSQLGSVNPLIGGAEESPKRSRLINYSEGRNRADRDTSSRIRYVICLVYMRYSLMHDVITVHTLQLELSLSAKSSARQLNIPAMRLFLVRAKLALECGSRSWHGANFTRIYSRCSLVYPWVDRSKRSLRMYNGR